MAAVGDTPARTIGQFCAALGVAPPPLPGDDRIEAGQALLWERGSGRDPAQVRVVQPELQRRRHARKYSEGELGEDRSFYFRGPDGALSLRVQNLSLFLQIAAGVDDRTWLHHLRAGDYSAWIPGRDQGRGSGRRMSPRSSAIAGSRRRTAERGSRRRSTVAIPDRQRACAATKPQPDGTLVKALARAWRWQRMLDDGVYASVSEIGDAENISKSYVSRILRLALLAPDIVEAILAGRRIRR